MKKILILSLMVISFNVYALDGSNSSPTNYVTTVFTEPVDQYLDVIDFNLLDSSVLFLQFDTPDSMDSPFSLGLGNQYSDFLYLGFNIGIENPGSDESDSSAISSTLLTDGLTYQGRTDILTTNTTTYKDSKYDLSVTAGLNLSAFTLGVNGFFSYDESDGGTSTYVGPVEISTTGSVATYTTAPTVSTADGSGDDSIVTSSYDSDGNIYEKEVVSATELSDGYINSINLNYGVIGGTQLKISKFAIELRAMLEMDSTDESSKADNLYYTTNYESNLSDYMGVSNASTVDKTDAEIIDINNQFTTELSASTMLPLFTNFDFEVGFTYNITADIYNDGGITSSYSYVNYESDNSDEFVTTDTTTTKYSIKEDISVIENTFTIPVTFTSNFNDRFVVAVENNFSYSINVDERTDSSTGSETITSTSTSSLVDDTKVVTSSSYYGNTETITTHNIDNIINAGAKFYLTENFRVNLGSTVDLNLLNLVKTSTDNNSTATQTKVELIDGEYVTTESNVSTNADSATNTNTDVSNEDDSSITYSAGVTYFLNDNLQLDLIYSGAESTSSIWEIGNWALLLTAQF